MPLFRRFGRPGLLGAVAPTAVVAGTATMTARAITGGRDGRARAQVEAQRYDANQHDTTTPVAAAPAESITSQLATLSSLKAAGSISDDEFIRAKRQVLGA